MSMSRERQKKSLLRAAKWIKEHPDNWNKFDCFGIKTSDGNRGFDLLGACYPYKREAFTETSLYKSGKNIRQWIKKNFPVKVWCDLEILNDDALDVNQAVRKLRSWVRRNY